MSSRPPELQLTRLYALLDLAGSSGCAPTLLSHCLSQSPQLTHGLGNSTTLLADLFFTYFVLGEASCGGGRGASWGTAPFAGKARAAAFSATRTSRPISEHAATRPTYLATHYTGRTAAARRRRVEVRPAESDCSPSPLLPLSRASS